MMQAAVKAKTEYNNIRTIASKAMGGTPGQAFQAQVHVSQAKRTLSMALGMKVPTPQVDNADEAPFAATDVAGPTLGLSFTIEPM